MAFFPLKECVLFLLSLRLFSLVSPLVTICISYLSANLTTICFISLYQPTTSVSFCFPVDSVPVPNTKFKKFFTSHRNVLSQPALAASSRSQLSQPADKYGGNHRQLTHLTASWSPMP